MSKQNIHVVPNKDEGSWEVKRAGSSREISSHRTQSAADDAGRRIARRDEVELITHGRNGQIRSKDSFGPDPNPPKDKEH